MLSRLDSEDDQENEKLQHFHGKTDTSDSVDGHNDSTKTEEPNTSQLSQTECKYSKGETKSARILHAIVAILSFPPFRFPLLASQWQTAKSGMYLREPSHFCPK